MIYTTKLTLYNSYFDKNDNLSAKAILSIFQDVASHHAEQIGVGFEDTFKKNLFWVLSRIKFDIIKMPRVNDEVIVTTWPHEKGRVDFERDVRIVSLAGETLLIGTTKWCVIDVNTRMIRRTDAINYPKECIKDQNYSEQFNKITLPQAEIAKVFDYTVRFSDLDHNLHMNNTHYAQLVLNACKNKNFTHFEINYLNECKENDVISVYLTSDENKEFIIGYSADKKVFTALIY